MKTTAVQSQSRRVVCCGIFAAAGLVVAGCGSKSARDGQAVDAGAAAPDSTAAASEGGGEIATAVITSARDSLKEGKVADAAARLAALQAQGTKFDAKQGKDYRQALSEAYDRAYEAIQRGDPKGQEALQLLRAASPQ